MNIQNNTKPNVMEVKYPRHILLVGLPDSAVLELLKGILLYDTHL